MLKCPRCGTNNAPSNASCIACGAALGGAPPGGYGGGYPQGYPGAAPPGAPGGAMPQGGGFGPPGAPQHGAPQHGAPPGAPGGYAAPGGYPGAGGYPGQQQHTPPGYGGQEGGYGHPHHPGAPQSPAGAPGMGQPGMGQPGMQQPGMQHPGAAGMPPGSQHAGMQNPGTAPTAPGLGGANQGKLAGFLLSYDIEPRGSFWPLRVGSNRIGRKGAADPLDIAIDHPTVSSNHALLNVEAEGALAQVEDSQSANGTLLHEKSIAGQGRRELRDGDQLRFGAVNVIVKLINPA